MKRFEESLKEERARTKELRTKSAFKSVNVCGAIGERRKRNEHHKLKVLEAQKKELEDFREKKVQ